MKEIIRSPHKLKKMLINDQDNYVETIGKHDINALQSVMEQQDGRGTVVRLFLGATATMPLRALTYVSSALHVAQALPCEQIQIISMNNTGARINGVDLEASHRQSRLLALSSRFLAQGFFPDLQEKICFLQDGEQQVLDPFVSAALRVMQNDRALDAQLESKGQKHGGDALQYAATHLLAQDTPMLNLESITGSEPTLPKRIVAVGCQQERLFYNFRMQAREHIAEEALIPSTQVFTHHVSPPYYGARHGEQSLEDALTNGVAMAECIDVAASRDIEHFLGFVERMCDE